MKTVSLYIKTMLACIISMASVQVLQAQAIINKGDTIYISNGTMLYINGSMQNLDNGVNNAYIYNDGILQLSGDLAKSPNQFYTGNDSLLLSGSGAQSIDGLTHSYMGIIGGGAASINGNTYIKNHLYLSNGTLNTGVDTVTLDSMALINEDSNNFVTGKVQMNKYLSKGINDTFGGIGLEINAVSLAPGMTNVVRTTGAHLSGNGYQGINRYFEVTPFNNGNTGATLIFHYFDNELNSIAENDLAVYRNRSNGQWEYNGFSLRNASFNSIVASVDTLGTFTAGSILHPLPVELLTFTASLYTPQSSLLEWQTAAELNNDHFDIERSEDGINFIKAGEEKGYGTTNTPHSYSYIDNFGIITVPALYYRLRQVDINGAFQYSPIRKIILDGEAGSTKAWYNAAAQKMEALIWVNEDINATLRMIDIQGKLIALQNARFSKGSNYIQFDMTGLAEGIYTLSIEKENGIEVKRMMKY